MGDSKRNSIAGKIATPKTSSAPTAQATVDTLEALGKAVGARVKLTTAAPHAQSYEGVLYIACPTLNLVAINTRASPSSTPVYAATQPCDYHIIPVSRIQTFQIVALASTTQGDEGTNVPAIPTIAAVDVGRLKQREEERIRQLKEEEQDRGKGVTRDAQDIFNALKKIGQRVRWHNQEMIVNDQVIVAPPYRTDDCRGPKAQQEQVNRVKTILQGERKKIKEREEKERKVAASTGPCKGG